MHFGSGLLSRLLWSSGEAGSTGEMVVYDERGVLHYHRIDELIESHDVLWDGEHFVLVATMQNTVLWLDRGGQVVRRWHAPGSGDAWHMNSLWLDDDGLYISAFGRFEHHRGWAEKGARDGAGFVMRLDDQQDVLTGLTCPHNPHRTGDTWLANNSLAGRLVELDPRTGAFVRESAPLGGWSRGLALDDEHIYVGVSANRASDTGPWTSAIAVLDRQSWEEVGRLEVPSSEIYDLVIVPAAFDEAVRTGFRTDPSRTAEQEQYAMFRAAGVEPARLWAIGTPIPEESCVIEVAVVIDPQQPAGGVGEPPVYVRNDGNVILVSAAPFPTRVAFQWLDPETGELVEEGVRTALPRPLPPGEEEVFPFKLVVPATPGSYLLKVTLVQEEVRWFDQARAENAWVGLIEVTP
jgi:hypothetical protein